MAKALNPIVRTITDAMWKRDKLQMRAAEALLSAMERPPRRRTVKRRARAAKGR
jgi:hypothetical protein